MFKLKIAGKKKFEYEGTYFRTKGSSPSYFRIDGVINNTELYYTYLGHGNRSVSYSTINLQQMYDQIKKGSYDILEEGDLIPDTLKNAKPKNYVS